MRREERIKLEDGTLVPVSQSITVPIAEWQALKEQVEEGTLYNTEEIITESGEWEAPVTGWYSILAIDGGSGAYYHVGNNYISGGVSGAYKSGVVKFVKGQKVAITIGAGGKGTTDANYDIVSGGVTEVEGVNFSAYSSNIFTTIGVQNNTIPQIRVSGAGFGGGYYNTNGRWWGGGGGGSLTSSGVYDVHDGRQGAVIMRWHDPEK